MSKVTREELEAAYKKEKDHRVGARMLAVHMVHFRKMSIDDAAVNLLRCPRWVRNWLERFKTGGLEGLRDLTRSGRPPKISPEVMDGILGKVDRFKTTPAELQQVIQDPMQNAPDAANHKITSELRWAWPYLKIPPATYFTNSSCSSM